jgi:hypothetical protein
MLSLDKQIANLQAVFTGVGGGASVELVAGVMIQDQVTGVWSVKVRGTTLPAIWLDSAVPGPGNTCLCAVSSLPEGQATAWVLGTTSSAPPAGEQVVVSTVSSTTCVVTSFGQTFTAYRVSCYTPVANDNALVLWTRGVPYLIGTTSPKAIPAQGTNPGPTPPPAMASSGQSTYQITDSGTWTVGYNWNTYFGTNTYTGSGNIPTSSGNWFYNGMTRALSDKTNINRVQFWLGSRKSAGNWSAPTTVYFYTHSSDTRPSTLEPTRTSGPFPVAIPGGFAGGWLDLPTSVGTSLQSGGGLSIYGDPYAGFTSGPAEPNAGSLLIDWSL